MSDLQMETDYARMFGEITEWVKQGAALSGDYRFERDGIQVDIMSQSPAGPFSCLRWKPLTNLPGMVAYLRPERRGTSFMGFIDIRGGGKQNWSAQESVDLIAALHARIGSVASDPPALRPPAEHAHLRWHWLVGETGAPFVAQWEQSAVASGWRNFAGWSGAKAMAACGVRYHGPCDPAAIIPDAGRIILELQDRVSELEAPDPLLVALAGLFADNWREIPLRMLIKAGLVDADYHAKLTELGKAAIALAEGR